MLNKIKARVNNKKGFTLVELIVVIVIILILAAVLVPNVTKYVANARTASLKSNASSILTQIQADCAASIATSELGANNFTATANDTYTVAGKTVTCVGTINAANISTAAIQYSTSNNEITGFLYSDNGKYITWSNSGEWGTVTDVP